MFLSPKAAIPLPKASALLLEAILFIGTGLGLFFLGYGTFAIIIASVWIVDRAAVSLLRK